VRTKGGKDPMLKISWGGLLRFLADLEIGRQKRWGFLSLQV